MKSENEKWSRFAPAPLQIYNLQVKLNEIQCHSASDSLWSTGVEMHAHCCCLKYYQIRCQLYQKSKCMCSPAQARWDPPSLSPGPPSSGAALPPCLRSAESTRGQHKPNMGQSGTGAPCCRINCDVIASLTFSASDKTVLAWIMATCSSFLKFWGNGKQNINKVHVLDGDVYMAYVI